jgi:hypothetical protein
MSASLISRPAIFDQQASARALGIEVPSGVLSIADEVVE